MKKLKNLIYFNYAALGVMSRGLHLRLNEFLRDNYEMVPLLFIKKYRRYILKLKVEASKLLNCTANEITYLKNTTEGIIMASELIPLKAGDEILITDKEYGANYIPWLKKQQDGFRLRVVDGTTSESAFNNLLNAINNKTKIIAISWVQYCDGYMADLARLSRICRQKNIYLVVDGIQGIGTRELDLGKIKIDILVCGGHKHLGAVPGSGFIYVNEKKWAELNHFKIGVRSVTRFDSDSYKLKDNSARFEDGTPNLFGVVSLCFCLKQINKTGIKNIAQQNQLLLKEYKKILCQNKIDFINYKNQGNIISLPVKNPDKLCAKLKKYNIYTKAIKDILRISFSYKSNLREFEKLVTIIKMSRL
ncbi:MAG: aminotransferase class V-fold PLP-dependent enzyme [Candidatus Falkowbacteria bacterium]